jgi:hypothetical protein
MNCRQVQELLPLFVGQDLEEKQATLVNEHLQRCPACARVATEYKDAFKLTQHFAAPVFSENVYAGVRRHVLREIETQATAPSELFAKWFRPRLTWALASAIVVIVAVFGLYFVASRQSNHQPVTGNHGTVSQKGGNETVATGLPEAPPSPANEVKKSSTPERRTPRNHDRRPVIAAKLKKSPHAAEFSARDAVEANSFPNTDSTQPEETLRVEIQTKNPNIRIIWFSQPNSKRALPNSKGI